MIKRLTSVAAVVLLAACGNQAGSEYVGKWVHTQYEKRQLEVVRNGESFLVRETTPSATRSGQMQTRNIPATLKDGTLQVQTGFGGVTLAIDKSSGLLTNGRGEYKRVE